MKELQERSNVVVAVAVVGHAFRTLASPRLARRVFAVAALLLALTALTFVIRAEPLNAAGASAGAFAFGVAAAGARRAKRHLLPVVAVGLWATASLVAGLGWEKAPLAHQVSRVGLLLTVIATGYQLGASAMGDVVMARLNAVGTLDTFEARVAAWILVTASPLVLMLLSAGFLTAATSIEIATAGYSPLRAATAACNTVGIILGTTTYVARAAHVGLVPA